MTTVDEEVREGSAPADGAAPEPDAEARAQARASVTLPDSVAFQVVTQSARSLFGAGMSALAAIDRAGSLRDAQPPTFRQAWSHHLQCARHYEAAHIRWPRLWWGAVHVLAVLPVLYALAWFTASPARSAVAAAVLAAFWYGR